MDIYNSLKAKLLLNSFKRSLKSITNQDNQINQEVVSLVDGLLRDSLPFTEYIYLFKKNDPKQVNAIEKFKQECLNGCSTKFISRAELEKLLDQQIFRVLYLVQGISTMK